MSNPMKEKSESDGVDRRGFLECMAWVGTGLAWSVTGGVLSSQVLGQDPAPTAKADFTFVQISDSHIGFSKPPNPAVTATLQHAIAKINALPTQPDLVIHTGDLTHLAKASEFDTVSQICKAVKTGRVVYVPGEHDVFTDDGKFELAQIGTN